MKMFEEKLCAWFSIIDHNNYSACYIYKTASFGSGGWGSQCLKSKSLIHKKTCFIFFFYGPNWQLWVVEVFVLVQMFHNQKFEDVHFLSKFSTEEKC